MKSMSRISQIEAVAIVQFYLVFAALLFELTGFFFLDMTYMLIGTTVLFVANVFYACSDLRDRALFLLLHCGMFLFWLTRPLIGTMFGTADWMDASSPETTAFSLGVIFLTMIFLRLGDGIVCCGSNFKRGLKRLGPRKVLLENQSPKINWSLFGREIDLALWAHFLRVVSLALFVVFLAASILYGMQSYLFSRAYTYEEFHLISSSAYSSGLTSSLAAMLPVAMCAYLATLPNKKESTVVLILYIFQTIPTLLTGARSAFVLAVIFLGFYYLIRHLMNPREGWISTKEIVALAIGLPLGVLLMGLMNYLRAGTLSGAESVFIQIADALYKQGVTFKTLQYGYNVNSLVQDGGFRFFTAGSLVNAITQGFVGQLFLGCELLPETNSADLALKGPWYSHAMSYYAHHNYLGGEGYGSSYVLELFADFGIVGVAVGSMVLGGVFVLLSRNAGKSWFMTFVLLMAARRVFFMPRGEFCEWISWIWSTRMLAAVFLILILTVCLYFSAVRLRRSYVVNGGLDVGWGANSHIVTTGNANQPSCESDVLVQKNQRRSIDGGH